MTTTRTTDAREGGGGGGKRLDWTGVDQVGAARRDQQLSMTRVTPIDRSSLIFVNERGPACRRRRRCVESC